MQEESKSWLTYSEENLEAARVLLESELYNPCLHNIQQSIEKALKSLFRVVLKTSIFSADSAYSLRSLR